MIRFILIIGLFLFPHDVFAQSWQELNKKSVELYKSGEIRKAGKTARKAVKLYQKSDKYSAVNHAKLALMAVEFYEDVDQYRDAGATLDNAIRYIEKRHPEGHEVLITLWRTRGEMRFMQGNIPKAKLDKVKTITAAENYYGKTHYKVAQEWLSYANWSKMVSNRTLVIRFLENAKIIMAENYPEDHTLRFLVDLEFAKLDLERERFNDAELKYKDVIRTMEGTDKDVSSILLPAYGQMARIYQNTGKKDKIGALIKKIAKISPYKGGRPVPILKMRPAIEGAGYGIGRDSSITFGFSISPEGEPQNIEIVNKQGAGKFFTVAQKALEDTRFIPKLVDGIPTKVEYVTYTYTLSFTKETPTGSRLGQTN